MKTLPLILVTIVSISLLSCKKKQTTETNTTTPTQLSITGNPFIYDTLHFMANNTEGHPVYWLMNDGAYLEGSDVNHAFRLKATFPVSLKYKDHSKPDVDTNINISIGTKRLNGHYHWYVSYTKDSLGHDTAWNAEEYARMESVGDSAVWFIPDSGFGKELYTYSKLNKDTLEFTPYYSHFSMLYYSPADHDIRLHVVGIQYKPHGATPEVTTRAEYRLHP